MKPIKFVIVAANIYPHLSPRSFRTTELAAGLARLGHDVTVYSLLGNYDYSDFEKEKNIKVKGLGRSRFGNINSDGRAHRNFFNKVLTRILSAVIDYPNIEFFFKTINALRGESNFDCLITIAYPFPIHWGAAYFKKYKNDKLFKVWISDCGDPFMGNPMNPKLKMFLKPIEKFWCKQTDKITIPTESAKNGYYLEFRDKISVIPQGVNFSEIYLPKYVPNKVPTFLYSGVIYPGLRDPTLFLNYLVTLNELDFKFIVYTSSDQIFSDFKSKLGDKLETRNLIDRRELMKILGGMDFLININNKSVVQAPSKLIDYALSKRPIMNISSDFTESERYTFDKFMSGDFSNQFVVDNISQFEITNVCNQFVELYKESYVNTRE